MEFVDGSQNLYRHADAAAVNMTVATNRRLCDVWGMQENESVASRQAVRALRARPGIGVFIPRGSAEAVPIAWRTRVFQNVVGRGQYRTCRGVRGVTPARWLVWQPLIHRESGRLILKINTHAVSGYASSKYPESDAQRDARAKAHWQACAELTRKFMAERKYDAILLGGDFNVKLENRSVPWYPGNVLAPWYHFDSGGIDRLIFTKGSCLQRQQRWSTKVGIRSDHSFVLTRYKVL